MDPETPSPPSGPRPPLPQHQQPYPDVDRRQSVGPPSLPSIHQLHPDLSPHRAAMPPYPSGFVSGSPYRQSRSPRRARRSLTPLAALRPADDTSEPEGDSQGPPKKKRRRQALSCTGNTRAPIVIDPADGACRVQETQD